jgi:16S rRNA (cytosine1402-N4)-methyltransferase
MWREVLEHLVTDTRGLYLDCTLGGGGHSEAILTRLEEPGGKVIALDQDPDALDFAGKRLEQEVGRGRFKALRANFRAATDVLLSEGLITPEAAAGTEPGPFAGANARGLG